MHAAQKDGEFWLNCGTLVAVGSKDMLQRWSSEASLWPQHSSLVTDFGGQLLFGNRLVLIGVVLAIVGSIIYFSLRLPPNVVPQSPSNAENIAWLGLATAFVGLLTGVVGLVKEIMKMKSDAK